MIQHLVSEAVGCLKRRLELELWLGFIRDSIEKIPERLIVVKRETSSQAPSYARRLQPETMTRSLTH